ncbi:class A beta-lactamase [Lentzea guizhouensis]|uniref:Beta-lactamase n=1 Tax=Lentzea guizhouensis TaxID=1586287 RepID=A0A1B2HPC8_9PSEU|nr:class A beta-lactamase [Lentzea guizhouensis]ANZ39545.1 class A beta-lactamase [Lentzea guizhouensis]
MAVSRRAFLAVAAVPLAGCAATPQSAPSSTPSTPPAPTTTTPPARHDQLFALEQKFGARLGVFAGRGDRTVEHRADERFAFCSTFKGLVTAAVLDRDVPLDTVVRYTDADLMKSSQITRQHVATGMSLRDLCDAAVRYSDGTAGNLLLRTIGGPAELTTYLRGLGDEVTRMDRWEPDLTSAVPDDPRDTSTPRALGTTYRKLVAEKQFLRDLMERNTTGGQRIRAGVPKDWKVADKTGTGDYGTMNDVGLAWPPAGEPLLISLMSSKPTADAPYDQALLAEAAAYVITALP